MKHSEAITIRQTGSTSSGLMCHDLILVHIMKALVSSAGEFELEYVVNFTNKQIKNILYDMLSSSYLPTGARATQKQYIRLDKFYLFDSILLSPLERVSKHVRTEKNMGIMHLDCSVFVPLSLKNDVDGRCSRLLHQKS